MGVRAPCGTRFRDLVAAVGVRAGAQLGVDGDIITSNVTETSPVWPVGWSYHRKNADAAGPLRAHRDGGDDERAACGIGGGGWVYRRRGVCAHVYIILAE